jgi:SAM-dependent methyltransferase
VVDDLWQEAAGEILRSFRGKSIVAPDEFKQYLESRVKCATYSDFSEGEGADVWVLHRGMAEEWPVKIRRMMRFRMFKHIWSNEVFSIVRPSVLPSIIKASPTSDNEKSLNSIILNLGAISNSRAKSTADAPRLDKYEIDKVVRSLMDVTGWLSSNAPNTSASGEITKDLQLIKANIKVLAWRIEQLDGLSQAHAQSVETALSASIDDFAVKGKICTSSDIYSDWHRLLASVLRADNYKLRKIWEWTYTIKLLHAACLLTSGKKGIGFGCGTEPLASCFANFVDKVHVTDAPLDVVVGKGWTNTNQHAQSLENAKYEWLAPRDKMDKVMSFDYVDMNNIPAALHGKYDFAWSSCALEHLGNKHLGLKFIVESAKCLAPGGLAIHTTEYDLSGECHIDNWPTVLFSKSDILDKLASLIHDFNIARPDQELQLLDIDFARGNAFLDGYVDIPPYSFHKDYNSGFTGKSENVGGADCDRLSGYIYPQINLSVDGYPSTSVAIIVRRIR